MNIAIITNTDKDKGLEYTKKVVNFILDSGNTPLLNTSLKYDIELEMCEFFTYNDMIDIAQFIIILGGDGTILKWCGDIAKYKKNILGINMGTLGYIADVEKKDGLLAIKKVIENDYKVEKRMMIDIHINGQEYLGLNELSINNGNLSKMIKVGIDINGQFVDAIRADGVIISTPTGSTAYNLSAGGPILKPDTELMTITYVCPHALFYRPYVISASDKIKIYLTQEKSEAFLSVDGKISIPIKYGDEIIVKKANVYTNIIKTTNLNFYDILRRKMFEIRK